ncbi:MAG: rRNA maturation RNase YbeY [Anaerolineae bacterium]|jgi:probable rRNA maturation factor
MSLHTVDVQVEESYRSRARPETLRQAAQAALEHQRVEEPCELAVVVTGDETLRQLNQRHRDVDAPTDVLAFPHQTKSSTGARFAFVESPEFPRYLGDIVISFPRAEAQAAEARNELDAELQLLVIHGVLHLLGHDDQVEPERSRMWQAQRAILDNAGVKVNLPD